MRKLLPLLIVTGVLFPFQVHAGAGISSLSAFIEGEIIAQGFLAFQGIALVCLFYFGFRMVMEAGKESIMDETKTSFVNSLIGFVMVALAGGFQSAFGTGNAGSGMNPGELTSGLDSVSVYLFTAAEGVLILIITIVALKMMATMGDTGEASNLKNILVSNCIGIVIMRIAQSVLNAVDSTSPTDINTELIGFANFLMTVIGFVAVASFIMAGIFLIVSVDEGLKDRAKAILIGSSLALLIALASYTLIITFA